VTVSFIGGGNRSTRRKPPPCRKLLTNFIVYLSVSCVQCYSYLSFCVLCPMLPVSIFLGLVSNVTRICLSVSCVQCCSCLSFCILCSMVIIKTQSSLSLTECFLHLWYLCFFYTGEICRSASFSARKRDVF
jgi:hypothetical protein